MQWRGYAPALYWVQNFCRGQSFCERGVFSMQNRFPGKETRRAQPVDGRAPLLLLLCAALAAVSLFAFLSQRNPGRGAGDGGAQGQPAPPADEGAASRAASDEADGLLLLVNPWTPLPEDFLPGELVPVQNDQAVDARAYPDLQDMLGDMSQAGLSPLICSSYRSQERQQSCTTTRSSA